MDIVRGGALAQCQDPRGGGGLAGSFTHSTPKVVSLNDGTIELPANRGGVKEVSCLKTSYTR